MHPVVISSHWSWYTDPQGRVAAFGTVMKGPGRLDTRHYHCGGPPR